MRQVRVKKVSDNFYAFHGGKKRFPGDEFPLEDDAPFSEKWMEDITPISKPKTSKPLKKANGTS